MSDIDYDQLREDILANILETNKARTKQNAEDLLQTWIDEYDQFLSILTEEARLRNIAQKKCGLQLISMEEGEPDDSVRTLKSLEDRVPDYELKTLEVKIRGISIRTTNSGKKLADIKISDSTGVSKITLWEREAEDAENGGLVVGDIIRIHGAYVDTPYSTYDGLKFEVKKSKNGRIEKNPEGVQVDDIEPIAIGELDASMSGVTVIGKVQKKWELKQTTKGNDYISITISDKGGNSIFFKAWREDLVGMINGPRVRVGDILKITDLRVDTWQGRLNLQSSNSTEIIFMDEDPQEYPDPTFGTPSGKPAEDKHIVEAREGDRIQFVGKIVQIYDQKPYYDSCPSPDCLKGIKEREDGTLYCPKGCTQITELDPVPVARCSGQITDGTSNLRFSAMGAPAEKIIGLDANRIKSEYIALYESSTEADEKAKVNDAAKVFFDVFREHMLQGFINVVANIKLETDFRGILEMMICEIDQIDYEKQALVIKDKIVGLVKEVAR